MRLQRCKDGVEEVETIGETTLKRTTPQLSSLARFLRGGSAVFAPIEQQIPTPQLKSLTS